MEQKVIVITGVADGMGREVIKILAKSGHIVAGFDVDTEGIASLSKELDKIGGEHYLEVLDIMNRKGVLKFRDKILQKYRYVDTVLSNVGMAFFSAFEEANLEKVLKCYEINVVGAAAIFQAFLPSMRIRKEGKLVAMSSLVGRLPFPFESIYASSKFAVSGLVQSFRYELEPFNIKVALIEPAQVSTSFAKKDKSKPIAGSPYYEREKRMLQRDHELIKKAPDPYHAARRIVKVVMAEKPRLFNYIDNTSSVYAVINQYFPRSIRDLMLKMHMNI